MIKLINKDFPEFSSSHVITLINECESKVNFDKTMGTQEIIDTLSAAKGNDSDVKMIMRICAYIGAADGVYDESEKLMARTIAYAIGAKLSDYNL